MKHRRRRTVFPVERNLRSLYNGNRSLIPLAFQGSPILDKDVGAIDLLITLGAQPSKFLETNSRTVPNSPRDLAGLIEFHLYALLVDPEGPSAG